MKIIIWGLGYFCTVSSACFAKLGYEVIGVDPNKNKCSLLKDGKSPIEELGLNELIEKAIESD